MLSPSFRICRVPSYRLKGAAGGRCRVEGSRPAQVDVSGLFNARYWTKQPRGRSWTMTGRRPRYGGQHSTNQDAAGRRNFIHRKRHSCHKYRHCKAPIPTRPSITLFIPLNLALALAKLRSLTAPHGSTTPRRHRHFRSRVPAISNSTIDSS